MFVQKIPALLHLVLVHHHTESHMLLTVFQQLVPLDWVPWHDNRHKFATGLLRGVPTSNRGSFVPKVCDACSRCNLLFKSYCAKPST